MSDIKIIVATHKHYWMPSDPIYLPLHVGREGKQDLGYIGDNTGDNISSRNANFCELTGLYWAWKNLPCEYLGLAHYRRHFSNGSHFGDKRSRVITRSDVEAKLAESPILLPTPRNYWIETSYSQYAHAHHAIDLDITREILSEKYPNYIPAYDSCMDCTTGHRFNMFIMRRDLLDEYCTWLFDILFTLESRLDISSYNKNDSRVFGFVSERLLDPWLETNHYTYKEIPYIFMENQNWLIKGGRFLKRKVKARTNMSAL